ncbi:MAG: hypothetical protein HYZ26_04065 [Chloroflexi bacterium]|nr:hypothetical protein [Chloroflexota bacterium]
MSANRTFTFEHALHLLAFGLALALRLGALDAIPLAENEAHWALQAHRLADGQAAEFGPQPLYVILTGFLFRWLGSGDQLARLLPALAGAALVAAPFLWRERLGRIPALALAFGLALDPGLVAVSRQAGGPMPALAFLTLGFSAWLLNAPAVAGVLLALGLLSGPALWHGLVVLLLAALADAALRRQPLRLPVGDLRRAALFGGGTLLLAGTLFLQVPAGLGAFGASLPAYFLGWVTPSGVPAGRLFFALAAYQPFALLFGVIGLARAVRQPAAHSRFLGWWLLAALALALLSPARQAADLVWALVPLWGLAAGALAPALRPGPEEDRQVVWLEAALLLVFFTYIWFSLASLGFISPENLEEIRRGLSLSIVVLALAVISTLLVGIGWSFAEAGRGALWGVSLFLLFFTISGLFSAAFRRETTAAELWWSGPAPGLADLAAATVGDLSEFRLGERTSLDVTVQTGSDAVAWELRDMPNLVFASQVSAAESRPALVTDPAAIDLLTALGYRGQSFAVGWQPAWEGALPPNLISWLLFRQAPAVSTTVLVWGRADLFPGGIPDQPLEERLPDDALPEGEAPPEEGAPAEP